MGLMPSSPVTAQTYTILHNFANAFSNNDGALPRDGLILSGNSLYGTTSQGGSARDGMVFKVNTDGTGFTNLHSFTGTNDGTGPEAGLVLSGNILYGTTVGGGSSGDGTVFRVNTDGTGFTNLYSFSAVVGSSYTNNDGEQPYAGLVLSGNTLYGTAAYGGTSGAGTVFKINTDGTGFTNLHNFVNYTNNDGANPYGTLILSGDILYGTTFGGGGSPWGTVFQINTDGTCFTNIYNFAYTNGANPYAGLLLSGNTLYGTTEQGGIGGYGTVFKVNTDGTGFTNLWSFAFTNGLTPYAGLVLSGNALYGTTENGGSGNPQAGFVFKVNTDGTSFNDLYNFANTNGALPLAGLVLSGVTLYGTTWQGGTVHYGTVFSLSFAPQLTISPFETNVVLNWPTNLAGFDYTGFGLYSTTNLVPPVVWSTVSPGLVIINGLCVVTNPASGTGKYYRLSQ